jgi:hypothetical protein
LGVLVNPDDVPAIASALTQILAGTHPLAILCQPGRLRLRSNEAYGYTRFVATVANQLRSLGLPAVDPAAQPSPH